MRANLFSVCVVLSAYFVVPHVFFFPHATTALGSGGSVPVNEGPTVRKDERWPLVSSDYGEISAVKINNGKNGCYYLHFITMNPLTFFLPAYLYSEMVFYVNSGSGTLSWIDLDKDDDKPRQINLQRGDVYRLQPETVFYIQNNLQFNIPQQLQIYAIFSDSKDELQKAQFAGAYVGIHDLLLGFDDIILQEALSVPKEVIEELRAGGNQSQIVQGLPEVISSTWKLGSRVIRAFLQTKNYDVSYVENNKDAYNMFKGKPDVESCYGWSKTVTKKQLDMLKDTNIGVFMVNLTKGAMMGPHWNQNYAEIAIVLHGQGMISVVCPTISNETLCKNSRFKVKEGDVFVVPRYHPMAQISFNNGSFVFVGFTMTSKKNHFRFLVGKKSILHIIDKMVLGKSLNADKTTMDRIYMAQKDSFLFECTSCAEEEERLMEEEEEKGKEGSGEAGGGGRPKEEEGKGKEGGGGEGRGSQEKEEGKGKEGSGGEGGSQEKEEGKGSESGGGGGGGRPKEEEGKGKEGSEGEGGGSQEKEEGKGKEGSGGEGGGSQEEEEGKGREGHGGEGGGSQKEEEGKGWEGGEGGKEGREGGGSQEKEEGKGKEGSGGKGGGSQKEEEGKGWEGGEGGKEGREGGGSQEKEEGKEKEGSGGKGGGSQEEEEGKGTEGSGGRQEEEKGTGREGGEGERGGGGRQEEEKGKGSEGKEGEGRQEEIEGKGRKGREGGGRQEEEERKGREGGGGEEGREGREGGGRQEEEEGKGREGSEGERERKSREEGERQKEEGTGREGEEKGGWQEEEEGKGREGRAHEGGERTQEEEEGKEGGGGRRQKEDMEGEIARMEEKEMQKREREAEESAKEGSSGGDGGYNEETW